MAMERKVQDVIRVERESVVSVSKPKLILNLTKLIEVGSDRAEFLKFCKRVEYTIRSWYLLQFEDLMQLYAHFNPLLTDKNLKQHKHEHGEMTRQQSLSPQEIKVLEENFLTYLFEIMEKSNFKILTDEEDEYAQSGQYLLNVPIEVDESKLDLELFPRYFQRHHRPNLPKFHNKYIIFRRGIGEESTSDYFYMEKLDMIIARVSSWLLRVTGLRWIWSKTSGKQIEKDTKKSDEAKTEADQVLERIQLEKMELQVLERIRLEKMELSLRNLFGKIEIKEPTFDRIIVVYRRKEEQGIYVKHFKNIPMADMELVLPEKKNPSLTHMDWVTFLGSAIFGMIALVTSDNPTANIWVVLLGLVTYCAKIYFTFQQNLTTYQNLIMQAMYEKQLDSGKGTLLHLCDDMIQQEVKEVIISYFILMKEGKLTVEELDQRCENFIKEQFDQTCNFDVEDAVHKLVKLRIIVRDSSEKICSMGLKDANEIIGPTTEERVLKAKQDTAD